MIDWIKKRSTKLLIPILSGMLVAGGVYAADVYYDIDAGEIVVSEAQRFVGALDITGDSTFTGDITANTDQFYIDSSAGLIGIGTTTLSETLTVSGTGSFTGTVSGANAVNSDDFVTLSQVSSGSTTTDAFLQGGNTFGTLATLGTNDTFGLAFKTDGNEAVRIDTSGNVGIGTTTPTNMLTINSPGSNNGLELLNNSDNIVAELVEGASDGGKFKLYNNGNQYAILYDGANSYINTSYNFGIGTTAPGQKLDVQGGNINTSGNLLASGVLTVSGTGDSSIAGNVGIGTTSPGSKLSVSGGASIGSAYDGTAAPSNGAIIEGNVGIGTTGPGANLEIARGSEGTYLKIGGDDTDNGRALAFTSSTVNGRVGGLHTINAISIDGEIALATAGTERVRITNAGNVGIGTTSPGTSLSVDGGSIQTTGSTNPYPSSGVGAEIIYDTDFDGGTAIFQGYDRGVLGYRPVRIRGSKMILSGGNVGIGTTAPGQELTVAGNIQVGIAGSIQPLLQRHGEGGLVVTTNALPPSANLIFGVENTGGSELFRITRAGNVGIGTTSPQNALDISGGAVIGANYAGVETAPANGLLVEGNVGIGKNTAGTYPLEVNGAGHFSGKVVTSHLNSSGDLLIDTSGNNSDIIFGNNYTVIKSGGNVGIGTTGPGTPLHVYHNDTSVTGTLQLEQDGTGDPMLEWRTTGAARWGAGIDNDDNDKFKISFTSAGTGLGTDPKVTVDQAGNVGIGTTSPQEELHISGSGITEAIIETTGNSDPNLHIKHPSQDWSIGIDNSNSQALTFSASDAIGTSDVFSVLTSGNVGIGTTSPDENLVIREDVAGGVGAVLKVRNEQYANAEGSITEIRMGTRDEREAVIQTVGTGSYGETDRLSIGIQKNEANPPEMLTIQQSGNVGIGTTSPLGKLELSSTIDTYLDISFDTNNNAATSDGGLRFWNDGDAGVGTQVGDLRYNGGTDTLSLSYGGDNNHLNIDSTGNVGIGTTSPQNTLDISSGDFINLGLYRTGNSTGWGSGIDFDLQDSNGDRTTYGELLSKIIDSTAGSEEGQMEFRTMESGSLNTHMAIDNNGNVGIGTTSPSYALDVAAGTGVVGRFSGRVAGGDAVESDEFVTLGQISSGTTGAFLQGGNSFGELATLGTNDAYDLTFETNNTRQMTIDTSGNVGIGTGSPNALLDIVNTTAIGDTDGAESVLSRFDAELDTNQRIFEISAVRNAAEGAKAWPDTAIRLEANVDDNSTAQQWIEFRSNGSGTGDNAIAFGEADGDATEWMIIDDGNVGIGTTSPSEALDVTGSIKGSGVLEIDGSGDSYIQGNVGIGTTSPGSNLDILGATATDFFVDVDTAGDVRFGSAASSSNEVSMESLGSAHVVLDSNNNDADKYFSVRKDGISTSGAELFRVQENGNVGIGTTSPGSKLSVSGGASIGSAYDGTAAPSNGAIIEGNVGIGTTSPSYKLHVSIGTDGDVAGFTDSNGTCTIDPTSTSLVCSSDARLKNVTGDISGTSSLESLSKLRGVSYTWKGQKTDQERYGFLAQEVQEVFPEFVKEGQYFDPDDHSKGRQLSIAYGAFTPVMIEAIQELDLKVDSIADVESDIGKSLFDSFLSALKGRVVAVKELVADKVTSREICLEDENGETCVDKSRLDQVLEDSRTTQPTYTQTSNTNDSDDSDDSDSSDEQESTEEADEDGSGSGETEANGEEDEKTVEESGEDQGSEEESTDDQEGDGSSEEGDGENTQEEESTEGGEGDNETDDEGGEDDTEDSETSDEGDEETSEQDPDDGETTEAGDDEESNKDESDTNTNEEDDETSSEE